MMTISKSGAVAGSLYQYSSAKTVTYNGAINLTTGKGSVKDSDGCTGQISGITNTKKFLNLTHIKNSDKSSRAVVWGFSR